MFGPVVKIAIAGKSYRYIRPIYGGTYKCPYVYFTTVVV